MNRKAFGVGVIDFFSGCGGTSAGLRKAGLKIVLGIDNDPDAGYSFAANFPESQMLRRDVRYLETAAINDAIMAANEPFLLFSACAPCQPFSKQRRGRRAQDPRANLLSQFTRFIRRYRPEYILVENVPGFQSLSADQGPFAKFQKALTDMKYEVDTGVVDCRHYGVPQQRNRLILLASALGPIRIPPGTFSPDKPHASFATVRDWIGHLPPIVAGETHPVVPLHRAAGLSSLNLQRIRATPEGGGREHWPRRLLAQCHRGGYDGHIDVYSRLSWDGSAPGLTTRCISFSNGRFGHPDQDRALSVREAALIQTFPLDFHFIGSLNSMARQIGNAVPVLLAEAIGAAVLKHAAKRYRARQVWHPSRSTVQET